MTLLPSSVFVPDIELVSARIRPIGELPHSERPQFVKSQDIKLRKDIRFILE